MARKQPPFPSREEVLRFIRESPRPPSKKDIARAFRIRGDGRAQLKELLSEIANETGSQKRRQHKPEKGGRLGEVSILEIIAINDEGEAIAVPVPWNDKRQPPHIIVTHAERVSRAPGIGDRALAKLTQLDKHTYGATLIRLLPPVVREKIIGMYQTIGNHGIIEPVNRKDRQSYLVRTGDALDARPGELVRAEPVPSARHAAGMLPVKIVERLGKVEGAKAASLIALHKHNIRQEFSPAALKQARSFRQPMPQERVDLRKIPLVTIDGEDARDFDDAVWAEADTHPGNPGGWHILVAIADVSHYVQPGDPLDREAALRGNSVYFPDRVVPMLPEELSNDLCSLRPKEDRYCVAVHLWINAQGETKKYEFVHGIMRSAARLTYEQVQQLHDENNSKNQMRQEIIEPLYGAYEALARQRDLRGTLDLDLPEFKVILGDDGEVVEIKRRERLDSHRLIEAFMIAANVAAARLLLQNRTPGIYRVHEPPPADTVDELRVFLGRLGYALSKTDNVQAGHFNKVLDKARNTPQSHIVSQAILRGQTQAYYNQGNLGHFGLGLSAYCHFTSPIRRYSDLIVHRGLCHILFGLSKSNLPHSVEELAGIAEHISVTERTAMMAEREALERYVVSYMADKVGKDFPGVVAGVTAAGLFVALDANGAQGFIPVRLLGEEFFHYDKAQHTLAARGNGPRFMLGQRVHVKVRDVNTLTGSLTFDLLSAEAPPHAKGSFEASRPRRGKFASRKDKKPKAKKSSRSRQTSGKRKKR